MSTKTLIGFVCFLACSLSGMSQVRGNISVISEIKSKGTNQSTRLNLTGLTGKGKSVNTVQEFVLYRDIIRKYTWYEGVGNPITQEEANHLPFYYRLTMKNKKGHWQHVEAMHQGKMTTNHNQTTYVIDKRNDTDSISIDWGRKLGTVSQWFVTPDLTGDHVAEERAYTQEGDLVYSFMPVKNNDGRITGCYNDAWGFPVDMRLDPSSTYGSVVCITYDSCGRDSIVDFLDGQGLRKYNSNGVDQQRYTYDHKDRLIMTTSHNMVGDYTIDNWGNCGNKYVYDDANNTYSVIRLDKDLNPMRMPARRAGETRTFIRCDIKRDKWGRDVEACMLDENGNADTTLSGIHKIRYNYDDKGNLLSTEFFDINGNKIK